MLKALINLDPFDLAICLNCKIIFEWAQVLKSDCVITHVQIIMNCKEIHIGLFDFVEGNQDQKTKEAFEQHLTNCPECAQRANFIKSSLGTIDSEKITEMDAFFMTRLEQRMKNRVEPTERKSIPSIINKWALAAMIVAIVGGFWLGSYSVDTLDSYSAMDEEILASEILPGASINTFTME